MADRRSWGGVVFDRVATIEPDRDPDGSFLTFMPQDRYAKRELFKLHAHGAGPFCRFKVPGLSTQAGVYVVTSNEEVRYVGIAENLARRWSLSGYGSIQPKNCYQGGQSTNCKINAAVLRDVTAGRRVDLYFSEQEDRRVVERRLIALLLPTWNSRANGGDSDLVEIAHWGVAEDSTDWPPGADPGRP